MSPPPPKKNKQRYALEKSSIFEKIGGRFVLGFFYQANFDFLTCHGRQKIPILSEGF